MRLITCQKCNSQFDVSTMTAGTSFVCGSCRTVLQVPAAGPVVQPIQPGQSGRRAGSTAPPPTVALSPAQMRKALQASQEVGDTQTPKPKAAPAARRQPVQPGKKAIQPGKKAIQPGKKPARTPIQPGTPRGGVAPPPTVALSPDQMRKAMNEARQQRSAGAAPAGAAKPQAQLPKAMQKRAQKAAPAQRAGAAQQQAQQQAQQPAQKKAQKGSKRGAAGKSSKGGGRKPAASGRAAPAQKKSQAPLFIGIGAVVLIAGVVGFVMMGDDGGGESANPNGNPPGVTNPDGTTETGTAPGAGTGGTSTAGANTPAPTTPEGKFLALDLQAASDEITRKLAANKGSVVALKELLDFYAKDDFKSSAAAKEGVKRIAKAALDQDKDCEWAHVSLGHANGLDLLQTCMDECPKAFEFADENEGKVREALAALEDSSKWVDAKKLKQLQTLVDAVRVRSDSLDNDPRMVQVEKARDWIRKNDLFKDLEVISRYSDPYVIFQEWEVYTADHPIVVKRGIDVDSANKDRSKKAQLFIKRDAKIFSELNHRYRELFAERYGMPELRDKNRLLKVLILWNRTTFDEWHRRQDSGISGFIRAYYSPTEKHIVHYLGDEALQEKDAIYCADGHIQKGSDQVTFHEGTHQLQHEYGAILRGTPLTDGDDPVAPRKSMWFDEGMAEFMGAVEIAEDKSYDLEGVEWFHNRLLLERIAQARRHRRNESQSANGGWWTISDLLEPNHNGELLQKSAELLPHNPTFMANIFYAQAWGLIHFMWYYDNGKYRGNLLDYQERVFQQEHGPEAFAKALGVAGPDDFGNVQKEFDWYWNLLLRRKVGRKRGSSQWETPLTTPPEGRWEPDEEDGGGGDYDDDDGDDGDDDEKKDD